MQLGRVAHGLVVKADHREVAAEGHNVGLELGDLGVRAAAVGESLAVGLDLARVRGDLLGDRNTPVEERSNLFEVLLCETKKVKEQNQSKSK